MQLHGMGHVTLTHSMLAAVTQATVAMSMMIDHVNRSPTPYAVCSVLRAQYITKPKIMQRSLFS
jgi:hypothetical protein